MSKRNPHVTRAHWRAADGHEYPVVDAPQGTIIMIQPTKADIKCAVAGDPQNCALAQAWKRQVDVPNAQIGIDKCYLPMRMNGQIVALRAQTTAATRRALDHFDRTGEFPPDGFMLRGVAKSDEIESARAQRKRSRQRWDELGKPPIKRRKSIYVRSQTHPAPQS